MVTRDDDKIKVFEFIEQNNITPVPALPDGAMIVCCLVKDFDYQRDREFWQIPVNQSVETNYKCKSCEQAVVMSRWTKSEYERKEMTNPICCPGCLNKEYADA